MTVKQWNDEKARGSERELVQAIPGGEDKLTLGRKTWRGGQVISAGRLFFFKQARASEADQYLTVKHKGQMRVAVARDVRDGPSTCKSDAYEKLFREVREVQHI